MGINKTLKDIIDNTLGEQNLYKIDFWKDPEKRCRHNKSIFCDDCRKEIEKELIKGQSWQ